MNRCDIAIVGMAGCYAGARNVRAFWHNILNKVDAVTAAGSEWTGPYLDPESRSNDRIYTNKGGFLHELAEFNPLEFGIMPSAVDGGEPDHYLALRLARDALADAGYLTRKFDGERAGIVLGRGTYINRGYTTLMQHGMALDQTLEVVKRVRPDFTRADLDQLRQELKSELPVFNAEMSPGLVPNVTTGIIANRLNLMGPNFIVDAACASSLIAVEIALRELASGRCDMMVTGGVQAHTPPQLFMIFCQLGALSKTSIRPFSKGADGTLLGEGAGVLVLKRLDDAEAAGDRIYAVIKGAGSSSDGRAKGLLAPRLEGEVLALRRAYRDAGIDPGTVGLIEAHGTATALGDKTEVESLTEVFGTRSGSLPSIALGSVKSMISHCIPAAGSAALIKTALALHHKVLPPTLCEEVNPELGLEKTPFYVNNETRPWIHGGAHPRRAGVNAFGFGGANAHVIVEEYRPRTKTSVAVRLQSPQPAELIALAAASAVALADRVDAVVRHLDAGATLAQLALASAAQGQGTHRLAIVADSVSEFRQRLTQAAERLRKPDAQPFRTRTGLSYGVAQAPGKVCLLFPGEGAQYPNMLADVAAAFPQVRQWFDFIEGTAGTPERPPRAPVIFPAPTGLSDDQRAECERGLFEMDVAAEAVWAASMGLHALLQDLGMRADAMLGHSTGENTALMASGVRRYTQLTEIADTVHALNRVYRELDAQGRIARGALLTVGALRPELRQRIVDGAFGGLQIAMDNCPNQLVLFGSEADVRAAHPQLSAEGAICAELPFGRAYHTPLFAPVAESYRTLYQDIDFGPGATPLYSCASAAPFPAEGDAIRDLACRQWMSRVRFPETIERLYADGVRVFLEVGPSANLSSFATDCLRGRDDVLVLATNSRRQPGVRHLLQALGQLFTAGVTIDLPRLYAQRDIPPLDLDAAPAAAPKPPARLNLQLPALALRKDFAIKPLPKAEAPAAKVIPMRPESAPVQPDPRMGALQAHFNLMQEFLDSQARVLNLISAPVASPRAAPVMPAAPPQPADYPMLGRIVEQTASRLVAEERYDLDRHAFLRDHTIGGAPSELDPSLLPIPVVPFTFSMEILAEAAARLAGGQRKVIGIEQARGHRWLALDEDVLDLRIVAEREPGLGGADRIGVRLFLKSAGGPPAGLLVFEGTVLLAEKFPEAPAARPWSSGDEYPAKVNPDGELYAHGMFHGPRLQGVKHVRRWGSESIDADLEVIPTHDYFGFTAAPRFQFDAALLDAAGQLAGYWLTEKHGWGFNCFPFRLGSFMQFADLPPAGTRVLCRGELRFTDEQVIEARFDLIANDRVIARATGWEDRKFSVPQRLYDYRLAPLDKTISDPWFEGALPTGLAARRAEPFREHFLDEGWGIWKRMLAHMALSRAERARFYQLPATGPRREEWLWGRLAAKEAVRDWIARKHQLRVANADIEILGDELGRPTVRCPALGGRALPSLSLAHSRRWAAAVVGEPGAALGMDYQRIEHIDIDSLARGALTQAESRQVERLSPGEKRRAVVAYWCAKEAVSKALGTGLQGRPRDWEVTAAQLDRRAGTPVLNVRYQGAVYEVALYFEGEDEILAVCVAPAAAALQGRAASNQRES